MTEIEDILINLNTANKDSIIDAINEVKTEVTGVKTEIAGKATGSVVTTTTNGLMIASDKVKLNGIATNANNYSLPTSTASVLGGVKTGTNITNSSGTISVNNATTTVKGVVQLTDGVASTSTETAATPAAVKTAYDTAVAKYTKPSTGIPLSDLNSAIQQTISNVQQTIANITSLSLANADFSATDFSANMIKIYGKMPSGAKARVYVDVTSWTNLAKSIDAKLAADIPGWTAPATPNEFTMEIHKVGNNSGVPNQIIIYPNNKDDVFFVSYDNEIRNAYRLATHKEAFLTGGINTAISDLNSFKTTGTYYFSNGTGHTNAPFTDKWFMLEVFTPQPNYVVQRIVDVAGTFTQQRTCQNGAWKEWRVIYNTSSITVGTANVGTINNDCIYMKY